jgi:hypothetical protein
MPPARRLEDRIVHLCEALTTQPDNFEAIVSELKVALREHTQRLRGMAADSLRGPRERLQEKRNNPTPVRPIDAGSGDSSLAGFRMESPSLEPQT